MTLSSEPVTPGGLTVVFEYTGADEGLFGMWYSLEIKQNGFWTPIPYLPIQDNIERSWESIGFPVQKDSPRTETIDWTSLYGELDAGTYRLIKDFINSRSPGDYDTYYLSVDFEINK